MPPMIVNRDSPSPFRGCRRAVYSLLALALMLQIEGCYYLQAAGGHIDIMSQRRPIEDVIQDADTPDPLRERLRLVTAARQFSIDVLYLPDNDSYRSYADLDREFAVWNVFAAPEFSLQAWVWCYPVAGCVNYRGYFSKDAAERRARALRRDGFDVVVVGVTAYSTLGRFADPVLSTMMRRTDVELVALLFHELAHQKLYVRDDTEFNESFATAVEEFGIERWLASRNEKERLSVYRSRRDFGERVMRLVASARDELTALYAGPADESEMRQRKEAILTALREKASREAGRTGRRTPAWLTKPLNNASLVPLTLYHGRLADFRDLLTACDDELQCFYERAEALARE